MTAILEFFQGIADGINSFFSFLSDAFEMIRMAKETLSGVGDTLSIATKILPPILNVAILSLIAIVVIIAVLKYMGFGGTTDE